ncbi:EF-hand domain-containing protein [Sphingomonas sp. BT-65]|uniref:EF-hand domain-containing protein n=1 Tax=Sphingomonas sp. BT-65 TaxID=2989821 RepID=UPI0022355937|nr:EF-hand domain-containing protein [Sphingomonas sp. BT-65]MCW4462023.1 EF-hand domain-containing protein [Sphingomonas sp. BT-65]
MKKMILAAAALLAAPAAFAQSQGDGMKLLTGADANRDGVVTRDEYARARAANFARMDRNKDGAVSKSDFKRLARFKPDAASRLDTLIAAMDANKDGKATRAEFEAAPMPLFDRADANGDGRIDANEMAAAKSRIEAMKQRR